MPRFFKRRTARRRTGRRTYRRSMPLTRIRALGGAGYQAPMTRVVLKGSKRVAMATSAWVANSFNSIPTIAPSNQIFANNLDSTIWVIPGYTELAAQYSSYRVLRTTLILQFYYDSPVLGGAVTLYPPIEIVAYPTAGSTIPSNLDRAIGQPGSKYTIITAYKTTPATIRLSVSAAVVEPRFKSDNQTVAAFGSGPLVPVFVTVGGCFLNPSLAGGANNQQLVCDAEIIWTCELFRRIDLFV